MPMIPAVLRIRRVSPTRVKVTITDERAPVDFAQDQLEGIPPAVHQPKELFSFYCDPLELTIAQCMRVEIEE